ncbi:MAG: protein-disulfide reductase DsbD family protein [Bdellovibrionales bacterium]
MKKLTIKFFITIWTLTFISTAVLGQNAPKLNILNIKADNKFEPNKIVPMEILVELEPEHYTYVDKLKLIWPENFKAKQSNLQVSKSREILDKFQKKEKLVAEGQFLIKTVIELPKQMPLNGPEITLGIQYQACSQKVCFLPKKSFTTWTIDGSESNVGSSVSQKESLSFESALQKGWFFTFLFVFFAGLLTSFTPCVFPMIPITLAVIGSKADGQSRAKSFMVSLVYVLGIALTYSILGVIAAQSGALFGSFMANPVVVGVIAGVLIMMSLSMFGLFEFKTPDKLTNKLMPKAMQKGYFGAFVSGLLAGVIASPCVGPVLVGILTFVAKEQSPTLGFFLLFTFAMGLGLLFLVLGTFSSLVNYLPKSGPWMNFTKFIFGISMLGLAIYFLEPVISQAWIHSFIGFATVALAIGYGRFRQKADQWTQQIIKAIAFISLLVGVGFATFGMVTVFTGVEPPKNFRQSKMAGWEIYSEAALKEALKNKKAAIIDFKADWCAACIELEKYTFSTPRFKNLSKEFALFYVDATDITDDVKVIIDKYKVQGLPTVVILDQSGNEIENLRTTGFEKIDVFAPKMEKALNN